MSKNVSTDLLNILQNNIEVYSYVTEQSPCGELQLCIHPFSCTSKSQDLKMTCNDLLVVKVNCWSYVFNIIKYI